MIIYFAPRMPLKTLFGPPISTFWGEKFLHYPLNFILMPKLAGISRMCLSVLFGSLLTGLAVLIIYDLYQGKTIKLKNDFWAALKNYASLFIIVLVFTSLFYFFSKIFSIILIKYFTAGHTKLLFLGIKFWLGPAFITLNFIFGIFIQSAFVYAIPILFVEKAKLLTAISRSLRLFKKHFVYTTTLVGLPFLLYLPIMALNANTSLLISKTFPEFILIVSIIGIAIASLVIDPLITLSTMLFYLDTKEKK